MRRVITKINKGSVSMSEKSIRDIYNMLKDGYYGSKKNVSDAEYLFFRWYRQLSFPPSAVLIKFRVSANIVTAFGALCLLFAFFNLALGQLLYGTLLYFFAYVVDFMDGNIARYTRQPTYFGRMIDGLVDALTFLLFIALGFGNVAAGYSILTPTTDIVLGIATGFAFLFRVYFYLRISFILGQAHSSNTRKTRVNESIHKERPWVIKMGKNIHYAIISGMPILLLIAVFLEAVTVYLIVYFLLFSLVTIFEIIYGLWRVRLNDKPTEG